MILAGAVAGCTVDGAEGIASGGGAPIAEIYGTADRSPVTEAGLVAAAARADFVLIGETHDNPEHHRLQARLVRQIETASPRPRAVAFEMIAAARQLDLVEHLAAHPDDAAGLGDALDWSTSGWPDWAMYRPIAEAALDAGAQIVATDLDRATRRQVFEQGAGVLPARFVARTGLADALPAAAAADLERTLVESHCGELPARVVEGMFRVQRARDAAMAERLATLGGRAGAILIAGNGHVRTDWGVPWYLHQLRPDARVVSIGLVEVTEGTTGRGTTLPYDFVWFTTAAERDDPCAAQAARLRQLRHAAED